MNFWKKGLLAKFILPCTCPYGQAEHYMYVFIEKIAQIPRNMLTIKQKKMVFKSSNPWWIIHAILAYVITYFGQAKNYVGQVKNINYLPGILSSDTYVDAWDHILALW